MNENFTKLSVFFVLNFFYVLFVLFILRPLDLGLVFSVMWCLFLTTVGMLYVWMIYYFRVKHELLSQIEKPELLVKNNKWRLINILQILIFIPIWGIILWIPLLMTNGSILGLLEDGSPIIGALGMLIVYYNYDKKYG